MADHPNDPPLEVIPDSGCCVSQVINLASVRIRHGRTPWGTKKCNHYSLIYSQPERRVWCEDCERTIDNFDAFLIFTRKFEEMLRETRHKMEIADEAMKSSVRRRATKALDHAWSGHAMAVSCPHCHGGLLPEDFVAGTSMCSRDIELARRAKKSPPPPPSE